MESVLFTIRTSLTSQNEGSRMKLQRFLAPFSLEAPATGRVRFGSGHLGAGTIWRQNFYFYISFSVATLFRFIARFARVRIEDSSRIRFALNGIQRDFFGGIFSGGIFSGGFYPDTPLRT